MSQTALFEFNIDGTKITPNVLIQMINNIVGTESGLSSIVDLIEREEVREINEELVTRVPFRSAKKWELILGVYDDDEFHLFKEVVELLLSISEGDLIYFREPQGQGESNYKSAIEISLDNLEDFTPDMSELDTYVIKK